MPRHPEGKPRPTRESEMSRKGGKIGSLLGVAGTNLGVVCLTPPGKFTPGSGVAGEFPDGTTLVLSVAVRDANKERDPSPVVQEITRVTGVADGPARGQPWRSQLRS
jgi:hypothetical protein